MPPLALIVTVQLILPLTMSNYFKWGVKSCKTDLRSGLLCLLMALRTQLRRLSRPCESKCSRVRRRMNQSEKHIGLIRPATCLKRIP